MYLVGFPLEDFEQIQALTAGRREPFVLFRDHASQCRKGFFAHRGVPDQASPFHNNIASDPSRH